MSTKEAPSHKMAEDIQDFVGNHSEYESWEEYDTAQYRRLRALRELQGFYGYEDSFDEFDSLPVEDYDGKVILDLEVEYGNGRGGEPDGFWIKSMEKAWEADEACPDCGLHVRESSFASCFEHEHFYSEECGVCGYVFEEDP